MEDAFFIFAKQKTFPDAKDRDLKRRKSMYVLCIKHSQFAVRSSQYSVVKDYKDSPASLSSQGIFLSFYPHFWFLLGY